jgi:hypothetical protein
VPLDPDADALLTALRAQQLPQMESFTPTDARAAAAAASAAATRPEA